MKYLDTQEQEQLRAQHRLERDRRIRDRIKAVLLYDKKWPISAIAEALLLSNDAIRNHISDYKDSKKLKPENGGSSPKLSFEQSQKLVAHLHKYTYLYVKDIVAYIQSITGIVYTTPGMHHWLRRHGFSYKKPAIVHGKANREKQQKWIKECNQLKQGLSKDEAICFIDGVHPKASSTS